MSGKKTVRSWETDEAVMTVGKTGNIQYEIASCAVEEIESVTTQRMPNKERQYVGEIEFPEPVDLEPFYTMKAGHRVPQAADVVIEDGEIEIGLESVFVTSREGASIDIAAFSVEVHHVAQTVVYECGNFEESVDPPSVCPYCDAEERDDETFDRFKTVSVTCPGWYEDDA